MLSVTGLVSCSRSQNNRSGTVAGEPVVSSWQPPASGTNIAIIKEKIKEDKLNNRYFSVQVLSTDSSRAGFYKVSLSFGYAKEETVVQFPSWTNGVYVKPVLLKGKSSYHAQLGFVASDTIFHPYYEIKVVEDAIKMDKVSKYVMSNQ